MSSMTRYVFLPAIAVVLCFLIRESFTVSAMGIQQQFPFGVAVVLVGFFLGFRSGLMMLLMTGLSIYFWGTHPGPEYPLALPLNVVLAIPALAVSASIRRLLNEQTELREMQADFIAILAHEVRTPLSTIKMAGENLQEHQSDEFSSRRGNHLILAAERIEDVVSRCMDVDLLELRKLRPKFEAIDLRAFFQDRIDLSVDPDRIALDCQISGSILSDPFLYGTVISNLLENALKYSLSGSQVSLMVREQFKRGSRGVKFRCENFINPDMAPDPRKLFRKYYRAESMSFLPGMGLGLWFSARIIQALSGSIGSEVTSTKVAFWVWVPCKP